MAESDEQNSTPNAARPRRATRREWVTPATPVRRIQPSVAMLGGVVVANGADVLVPARKPFTQALKIAPCRPRPRHPSS
jgi:hypothetical protein